MPAATSPCAGLLEASQFTDEETARETQGAEGTVASGRMSLTFAIELLRRYFGSSVFNHTGFVDLRFLRPVRPGDTITYSGTVTGVSRVTVCWVWSRLWMAMIGCISEYATHPMR